MEKTARRSNIYRRNTKNPQWQNTEAKTESASAKAKPTKATCQQIVISQGLQQIELKINNCFLLPYTERDLCSKIKMILLRTSLVAVDK